MTATPRTTIAIATVDLDQREIQQIDATGAGEPGQGSVHVSNVRPLPKRHGPVHSPRALEKPVKSGWRVRPEVVEGLEAGLP